MVKMSAQLSSPSVVDPTEGSPLAHARIFSALILAGLATLLIAPSASAAPETLTINGITYTADDSAVGAGATATAYDGSQGTAVVIPATVNLGTVDYAVTTIGPSAFQSKTLTAVTLPSSLTTIGFAAFNNNQLASLTIPNGVTTIGNNAFELNLLVSVTIPNSVTTIGDFAFMANLLTSVTIPANVTTLGWSALGTSLSLASVKFLGSAPTTIGTSPLGTTGTPSGPLVSYYARNSGFATPTWGSFGGYSYMSQALATVTFDANGHGTAPAATDVVVGQSVANPGALTAAGFTVNGWFAAASGGTAVAFPDAIAADTTLYAQWSVAPAAAATGSNLAATGSNDTLPLGALAFLLVGAGAAIIMRQRRSA